MAAVHSNTHEELLDAAAKIFGCEPKHTPGRQCGDLQDVTPAVDMLSARPNVTLDLSPDSKDFWNSLVLPILPHELHQQMDPWLRFRFVNCELPEETCRKKSTLPSINTILEYHPLSIKVVEIPTST